MASGDTAVFADIEDFIQCDICLYPPKTPKVLPCGHSFCLTCLEQTQASSPPDKVQCPTCRADYVLPGGLTLLPTDHRLNSLGNLVEKHREDATKYMLYCGICKGTNKKGGRQPAFLYCTTCGEMLCKSCGKKHRRLRESKHHVLAEFNGSTLRGLLCEEHEKRFVQCFCLDCGSKLCKVCTHTSHRSHKTSGFVCFSETQHRYRNEMCRFLERSIAGVKSDKDKLKCFRTKCEDSLKQTKRTITKTYYNRLEEIQQSLQEQEQKLHEEIDNKYKTLKGDLTTLDIMLDKAESCLSDLQANLSKNLTPLKGSDDITSLEFPSELFQNEYTAIDFPVVNIESYASVQCQFTPGNLTNLGTLSNGSMLKNNHIVKNSSSSNFKQNSKPLWETKCGNISDLVFASTRSVLYTCHDIDAHKQDIFQIRQINIDAKAITAPPTPVPEESCSFCTVGGNHDGSIAVVTQGPDDTWQAVTVEKETVINCLTLDRSQHQPTGTPVACSVDLSGNLVVGTLEHPNEGRGKTSLICYSTGGNVLWHRDTSKVTGPGHLITPWSLCVDPFNRIIVADYVDENIKIFSEQGDHLRTFHPGEEFSNRSATPASVCTNNTGEILVAFHEQKFISLFTPNGRFIKHVLNTPMEPKVISITESGLIAVGSENDMVVYDINQQL